MRCEEVQPLIDGYLDGELDFERNREFERHLKTCAACVPAEQSARKLRAAIKEGVPYFHAPPGLEQRLRANLPQPAALAPRPVARSWQWIGAAAALLLILFVAARLGKDWLAPSHDELIAEEIVAGHIRSLMANHLSDVTSTDQHTVKPWFDGKLDFAPPVVDLAQAGFPLVGGRLDYIDSRPVAALVYQRRLHTINLFVWPSSVKQNSTAVLPMRDGYNMLQWTQGEMTFWAVSDLAGDELQTFVSLFRK